MDCLERNRTPAHARPWRRLHLSTWVFLVLPVTALALANLPGRPLVLLGKTTWEHGWPCVWLVRQGFNLRSASAWAIDVNISYVDGLAAAANFCVALLLLALIAAAAEWRRRRRRSTWQFTIGDLLAVMLIIGIPLQTIAERRAALARFRAVANGFESNWEAALPAWLPDRLYDVEFFDATIWQLGAIRPDDEIFELPEDQALAAALRSLLDCGPQNILVQVTNQEPADREVSLPEFDPAVLQSLAGLQHLALERADDDVLACLDSLPELRSLQLNDCGEPISPRGAMHLNELCKLRELRASHKCLGDEGVAAVASLTSLEALSLSGATDDDLVQISRLKRLRHLALHETNATDAGLKSLAALSRLETLNLSGYAVTGSGLTRLSGLPHLMALDLSGCGLTDSGLAALENFGSLQTLRLAYTPITGRGLLHLAQCRELRQLDLSGTELNDAGLATLPPLPSLEVFHLDSTRITEEGLVYVNRLAGLRELWLTNSRPTDLHAIDLTRLPKLMLIDFDGSWVDRKEFTRLQAARPEIEFTRRHRHKINLYLQFENFLQLARGRPPDNDNPIRISLLGPEFGDLQLADLHGLAALQSLRLNSTRITDGGLEVVTEFDRLEHVDLTDTPVSDACLAPLARLPRLKRLDLSYTAISANGLATLARFPALEGVGLDPSQVTFRVVRELKRIPSLKCVTITRERAPWGRQYRGARDFDEFMTLLQEDMPGIDVSLKEYSFPYRCIEY